jgi:hypothetical protein
VKHPLNIIIAQAGWVFVGHTHREGDQVVIDNARNIRRWGTTTGLGQLALHGPAKDTVLDDYGTVKVPVLGVIGSLDCNEKAWK